MFFDRGEVTSPPWLELVFTDLSRVTEPGCSQGSPPWELRCQLYSQPFVFSSLLSPRNQHGNITANARGLSDRERERKSSSLYWNLSVQFYTVIEAFMNIKVGLVCFIHCVGQSLTPRVWVTVVWRLYKVSSISHQRQKPMKARSVWHPTFISPHLSSDWSWARSNYMNNRQRGINQRRHLKIMPRPENDQLLSDTSRVLAGMMQLYWRWRLWCEIFVVCHVRLSQTVSDCLFEWHYPGHTNGLADIAAGLRSSIIKQFKPFSEKYLLSPAQRVGRAWRSKQ